MTRTLHFPLNSLALKRGGLVKAVRDRASTLAAHGSDVTIETLGGQARLFDTKSKLVSDGQLDNRVHVRDVLFALAPESTDQPQLPPQQLLLSADETVYSSKVDPVIRTFVDGLYRRYIRFSDNPANYLDVIEYFGDDRKRYLREEFDSNGIVCKRLDYSPDGKYPTCRRFYSTNSVCYLTIWANPITGKWSKAFFHPERRQFSSMIQLYSFALTRLLSKEKHPAITTEFRDHLPNFSGKTFDESFYEIDHPDILKIAVCHSNHLRPPYTVGSGMQAGWGELFSRSAELDDIVVWTQAQANDIRIDKPAVRTVSVCPPIAPDPVTTSADVIPGRLVMVARIDPKKRVDLALRVLSEVRRTHPDVTLDIFGFDYGDDTDATIKDIVRENNLEQSITFRGFASGLDEIYDGAVATLFTSLHEGLGLVLLESMSRGVPVVATDAKYGPSDIVVNGENGFLVDVDDESGLVDAVNRLLDNDELRNQLSAGAVHTARSRNLDRYLKFWRKSFERNPAHIRKTKSMKIGAETSSSPRRVSPAISSAQTIQDAFFFAAIDRNESRQLVVKQRDASVTIAQSRPVNGWWRITIPTRCISNILDLYLECQDGIERRIDSLGNQEIRLGDWLLYSTKHGALSLKYR